MAKFSMKDVDPDMGEAYRDVLEECMTDEEKKKFKETWDSMDDKNKSLRMTNIWKFLKKADISMSTIRRIRRRMNR